jgi:Na+-driven multidrug efflux pump
VGMTLSNVLAGVGMYIWMRKGTWKFRIVESAPTSPEEV